MECDVNLFAQLYEMVYRDLYRFALCMMRNVEDAEDAVSEAVVSGYVNIGKLRNSEVFKSWMFTILSNICKKKLLRQSKEREHVFSEPFLGQNGDREEPGQEPDYGMAMDVKEAFFILSQEEQMIVGLSVFGGYDSREIAELMKLNSNTVRSKRKRALEKMKCVLK